MNRGLAIFTQLLRGAAFDHGIFVGSSLWAPSKTAANYLAPPAVETVTAYTEGTAAVAVLQLRNALPLSRLKAVAKLSGSLLARKIRGLIAGDR